MTTYTKETALYDTGAISNDITAAGQTASKFLSADSSGIMVYDGSNGAQNPSTVASGTKNVFIDDDSVEVRNGTTSLAAFTYGEMYGSSNGTVIKGSDTGVAISANQDSEKFSILIHDFFGLPVVTFGSSQTQFNNAPLAKAISTNANLSLSGSNSTPVKLPLSDTDFDANDYTPEADSYLISVASGNIVIDGLEPVNLEISASVYVAPSATALFKMYLYRQDSGESSWTEIASSSGMMTVVGGAIQMIPTLVDRVYMDTKFYIGVRVFGGSSITGTLYCKNKDTWVKVKYL